MCGATKTSFLVRFSMKKNPAIGISMDIRIIYMETSKKDPEIS